MNYTILAAVIFIVFIISYNPQSGTLDRLFIDAPDVQKKNNLEY